MDYTQIGAFIKECRKKENMTQENLAEKLHISFKTVSRWECGLGLPDVATMLPLCEFLHISVNDLLNGQHIDANDYMEKAEEKLLEMQKEKEETTKRLLTAEIVITAAVIILTVSAVLVASFVKMTAIWRLVIILGAVFLMLPAFTFCLYIEQKAGYYKCEKCGHTYVPTFKQVFFAMHMNRTRYMKCPCCHERSWQKKVIHK